MVHRYRYSVIYPNLGLVEHESVYTDSLFEEEGTKVVQKDKDDGGGEKSYIMSTKGQDNVTISLLFSNINVPVDQVNNCFELYD